MRALRVVIESHLLVRKVDFTKILIHLEWWTNGYHVTNVKWYQRPPKAGINKEKTSCRNICFPYETRISDQGIYKTTWILLKAEEGNNEDHPLHQPTLRLQLSLGASNYTNRSPQTTALSCMLWFLTMTLNFAKLFHWRLVLFLTLT